ncbi:hypothetical protein [Microbispora bryophytorum]
MSQMKKWRERIDEFVLLALALVGAVSTICTMGALAIAGLIKLYLYLFG